MIKVLFVCLGNICRSPMAEGILQHKINQAGLKSKIMVDSAGTGSWHVGDKAHKGTRNVLKKHDIAYEGRARQFTQRDLSNFDYILAMDSSNLTKIRRYAGGESDGEIGLFLTYAKKKNLVDRETVPDPYYDNRFDDVYALVDKGCDVLLAHIREAHNI